MVVYRLRQPLIIAYILTGIIAGPGLLALTSSRDVFDVMSQIGVAFLLFTVGLGLNWKSVKDVSGIALATGVGQVLFTSVSVFLIGFFLGFDPLTSAYLGIAFSFSSTIIIVKLLMDKEDLDTLYGRISVGFLLVQDFIAMLVLLGLSAVGTGASLQNILASTLVKAVLLVPIFWLISAKLLPRILKYVAKSQELLFIFAVAWCFLIAGILVYFGFGVEIGALIAGITLSSSVYYREINARVRPLRDFFLVIFSSCWEHDWGSTISLPPSSRRFSSRCLSCCVIRLSRCSSCDYWGITRARDFCAAPPSPKFQSSHSSFLLWESALGIWMSRFSVLPRRWASSRSRRVRI